MSTTTMTPHHRGTRDPRWALLSERTGSAFALIGHKGSISCRRSLFVQTDTWLSTSALPVVP